MKFDFPYKKLSDVPVVVRKDNPCSVCKATKYYETKADSWHCVACIDRKARGKALK